MKILQFLVLIESFFYKTDFIAAFKKTPGFQPGDEPALPAGRSNADMSFSFRSEAPRYQRGENVILLTGNKSDRSPVKMPKRKSRDSITKIMPI